MMSKETMTNEAQNKKSTEEKLAFAKELGNIVQIGIVVEDIEKTKQSMRDIFGLEPDAGGESLYRNCLYRSEGQVVDAPVISAFYNFFSIQLEFLQPVGDTPTVWRDYLDKGQFGLHHIRFDVDDNDRITKLMEERGIDIWMEGQSLINPKAKFTYYDSLDELGFVIEVVTRA